MVTGCHGEHGVHAVYLVVLATVNEHAFVFPPRLVERHAMEVMSLVLKNSMPCVTKHYFVQVWI